MAGMLLGRSSAASPADLFGVGPRSQGLGRTGVAAGEDDHQAYTNPALLGGRSQQHLSIGYQTAQFKTQYQAEQTIESQSLTPASVVGATLPLPLGGVLSERLALGLSIVSPRRLVTRAELWFPERPQFPLLACQADSLSLTTGLGVKLHQRIYAGIGVRWLASLVGDVLVQGSESGETTTVVRDKLVTSRSPVLGLKLRALDELHLGLVWRAVHRSDLDIQVQLSDLGTLVLPELHIAGTPQYDPARVDAEVAYELSAWRFAGLVSYRRWSAFEGFLARSVDCPEGEQACGTPAPPAANFRDTWSPQAAVAYSIDLGRGLLAEARVGGGYQPTPIPEQVGRSNYWDNARWLLTAGYGVRFAIGGVPLDAQLALQRHWLVERSHRKIGAARESQPELSQVTTAGHITLVAVALGVSF